MLKKSIKGKGLRNKLMCFWRLLFGLGILLLMSSSDVTVDNSYDITVNK
jgi:hypothetical protein